MPTCTNCHYRWNWKETMTISYRWFGSRKMTCPACHEEQYISARSQQKLSMIILFFVIIILLSNLVFGPSYFFVILLFALIPVNILGYPWFIKLTDKKD